jgi:hypothetical protein
MSDHDASTSLSLMNQGFRRSEIHIDDDDLVAAARQRFCSDMLVDPTYGGSAGCCGKERGGADDQDPADHGITLHMTHR